MYHLDIGVLLQKSGLIDRLVVDGRQHDVFHAVVDGLFQLFYLLCGTLGGLGSHVGSGHDAVRGHGHATEIREFWEICRKNIPVSQLICKKHKKKFGWKQNMLYICDINFIKDI